MGMAKTVHPKFFSVNIQIHNQLGLLEKLVLLRGRKWGVDSDPIWPVATLHLQ